MKQTMVAIIAASLMAVCAESATAVAVQTAPQVQQKHQKQRAQLIGQGKSSAAATTDARSNAMQVAGTYSFTTVSQRTTGKGEDWTCILIIEYKVKLP